MVIWLAMRRKTPFTTGWGILMGLHFASYVIFKNGIVNLSTVAIIYHLTLFLIVNAFLFFVDWFSDNQMLDWFWYAFGFWTGIFVIHLIIHFYIVPRRGESNGKSWMDRKIEKELDKLKK